MLCHDLVVHTVDGRHSVTLSTVELVGPEGRAFLHALAGRASARPRRPVTLTPRQQSFEHLARGIPVKALARRLGIRETTARNPRAGVLAQLGAHSQLEAVAVTRRLGLVP